MDEFEHKMYVSSKSVVIELDEKKIWSESRMPHPLLTKDFDEHDEDIRLAAIGSAAKYLLNIYAAWFSSDSDVKVLIAQFDSLAEVLPR